MNKVKLGIISSAGQSDDFSDTLNSKRLKEPQDRFASLGSNESIDDIYATLHRSCHEGYQYIAEIIGAVRTSWAVKGIFDLREQHTLEGCQNIQFPSRFGDCNNVYAYVGGTTWLDIWEAADRAVCASGETRHVAIESFKHTAGDPIAVLKVGT